MRIVAGLMNTIKKIDTLESYVARMLQDLGDHFGRRIGGDRAYVAGGELPMQLLIKCWSWTNFRKWIFYDFNTGTMAYRKKWMLA